MDSKSGIFIANSNIKVDTRNRTLKHFTDSSKKLSSSKLENDINQKGTLTPVTKSISATRYFKGQRSSRKMVYALTWNEFRSLEDLITKEQARKKINE
jgi:hypothetical protein